MGLPQLSGAEIVAGAPELVLLRSIIVCTFRLLRIEAE
jgi:hypothetical protein